MKKFSVNLLKVGILLILGLCMFGAMSQVNAVETRIKVEDIFKYDVMTLNVGENKEFSLNLPVPRVNKGGISVVTIGDDEMRLEEYKNLEKCSCESKDKTVAKVNFYEGNDHGEVTGVAGGDTKIVIEYKFKSNGNVLIYYDEMKVIVVDDTESDAVDDDESDVVDDNELDGDNSNYENPTNDTDDLSLLETINFKGIIEWIVKTVKQILEFLLPIIKTLAGEIFSALTE